MSTVATPSPEAPAPASAVARTIGALFSPKETFREIARAPGKNWVLAALLLAVLGAGVAALMNQKVDWENYIRQRAEKSPRFEQLSEEQKQQTVSSQAKWSPPFAYVIGVLHFPAVVFFASLFYFGAFNLFYGAKLGFGQSISITAFANAGPSIIASVLILITLMLKPLGDVNPETMLASHFGALISDDAPAWQRSLASSVELFDLWGNVLAAIGFAAANPKKISLGKGVATVFAVWLLWALIKAGSAGVFS